MSFRRVVFQVRGAADVKITQHRERNRWRRVPLILQSAMGRLEAISETGIGPPA